MDTQHREIRAQLSAMAPRRAISYIRSFDLPPDEAASLIECDVRGRSCVQAAELLHLSVDGLAKLRRRAGVLRGACPRLPPRRGRPRPEAQDVGLLLRHRQGQELTQNFALKSAIIFLFLIVIVCKNLSCGLCGKNKKSTDIASIPSNIGTFSLVPRRGFEPRTPCLKGRTKANVYRSFQISAIKYALTPCFRILGRRQSVCR